LGKGKLRINPQWGVSEEVAPLAVIAPVGYLDLLAVHAILNPKVPHSLPVRMIPVDSLQQEPSPKPKKNDSSERSVRAKGFENILVKFCP